ncbi:MAG: glucosaminidase domain-containing protein, partial [Clostridia bacterium]|nr:glucosaminidase domain-containing protein [Clostridia bacterium]
VQKAYPSYPNAGVSGYSFKSTDPTKIPSGTHKLTVKSVGNDGGVVSKDFTVTKLSPQASIDNPASGASCIASIDVRGWAINASGIRHVYIYLDSNKSPSGEATLGISRPDVQSARNASGGYLNASTSGYDYKLDISAAAVGQHTITVKAVGLDGEASVSKVTFKIGNVSVSFTSCSVSLSTLISEEMSNYPELSSIGYAVIQSGLKGYRTVINDSSTFHANTVSYNTILQQVTKYTDPTQLEFDPLNIYQFLRLSWTDDIQNYQNSIVSKFNTKFASSTGSTLIGQGQTFYNAAKVNNLNPVYLAGQAILESGNGTSTLAKGVMVNGKKCYNFFGIHATDSDPVTNGSNYAYSQGWYDTGDGTGANNGIYKAIYGGAAWISSGYINRATNPQDTLYEMRWNVNNISHQYATDVLWAQKQTSTIKSYFDLFPDIKLYFDIPVYQK